jgi:hypothetical protein
MLVGDGTKPPREASPSLRCACNMSKAACRPSVKGVSSQRRPFLVFDCRRMIGGVTAMNL